MALLSAAAPELGWEHTNGDRSDRPPPGSGNDSLPLLSGKRYDEPSVFIPENLLREARRQRSLPDIPVPEVALLDPDGDIVRYLAASGTGQRHPGWACYHTEMWTTDLLGVKIGVVGAAVGAPFAVLVAEQLAASGARLVISITSAGLIGPTSEPPYFLLIQHALRDEGTSAHYLPPGAWSHLSTKLQLRLNEAYAGLHEPVLVGSSWTTDAPYRETPTAVAAAERAGISCVEMEAAALYAYATARDRDVVCLAHLTNTMATQGDDFEKGPDNGAPAALAVARATAVACQDAMRQP
ncbi:MAG: nucleoside phosphorylase [Lapillicoccus sp.]